MMLCDADFDELFPPEVRPDKPAAGRPVRQEDIGGHGSAPIRFGAAPSRVFAADPFPASHGYRTTGPVFAGPAFAGMTLAMMPAFAAYGATSAVLARYASASET